jgi:hypothetical protein
MTRNRDETTIDIVAAVIVGLAVFAALTLLGVTLVGLVTGPPGMRRAVAVAAFVVGVVATVGYLRASGRRWERDGQNDARPT